ncbi:emp24/gp25L/p24 family/GOLD [Nesidiocoris tenuis]|nr:emp24/gp25L/p24 family/GOLD [Nesidiocoris tenuis]
MDYKIHVDPGKEDCFFQYVNPSATFYVSFQVLRGGDGKAGFAVRHPNGNLVLPYAWQASSEYQDERSLGGYYQVCVDNQFSRFASKVVNVYMTVIRYDQWDAYAKEIEALDLSVANFTSSIQTVERNINEILQQQNHFKGMETRHFNVIEANRSYVLNWSLAQIVAIVSATCLQVHFVRKLFDTKTSRPRA